MDNIVVIGGSHHNTLGVVRSLGEVGLTDKIRLIIVGDSNDFVSRSKYVRKENVCIIPNEDLIESALYSFNYESSKPTVICCGDSLIGYIDKHSTNLSVNFVLPNARKKTGEICRLLNKETQLLYAQSVGLETPISLTFKKTNLSSLNWNVYPCIIKPIDSTIGGKRDIYICQNKEVFFTSIENSKCENFQVQEYIDKDFEFQLIGCSLDGGDNIYIPGFTRIIRQPNNTNTGYLKYSHLSQLDFNFQLAENFIKEIGYSGLFSLEFLRGKNGKDYFMEINMRNDGNAYCVTKFGVNLPYIWHCHCMGREIPRYDIPSQKFVMFMPELSDIKNIGKVGIWKWLKEFINSDCYASLNISDLKPFFYQLAFMVKGKVRRTLFRKTE